MTSHVDTSRPSFSELRTIVTQFSSVIEACEAVGCNGGYLAGVLGSGTRAPAPESDRPGHEQAIARLAIEQPGWAQIEMANTLCRRGITVTPAQVQGVLKRLGLGSTKRRVRALICQASSFGLYLSERQVTELLLLVSEAENQPCNRELPGELGVQDTYYVGDLQRIGRVYQQTFIDTYAGVAFAKLYCEKSPRSAVDLLEERVLPCFAAHDLRLRRVLTDRGTEFCGYVDCHPYEQFLWSCDIEHSWTHGSNCQSNHVCRAFHARIYREFYRDSFLSHDYRSLYDLQRDLDRWLESYNATRRGPGVPAKPHPPARLEGARLVA